MGVKIRTLITTYTSSDLSDHELVERLRRHAGGVGSDEGRSGDGKVCETVPVRSASEERTDALLRGFEAQNLAVQGRLLLIARDTLSPSTRILVVEAFDAAVGLREGDGDLMRKQSSCEEHWHGVDCTGVSSAVRDCAHKLDRAN